MCIAIHTQTSVKAMVCCASRCMVPGCSVSSLLFYIIHHFIMTKYIMLYNLNPYNTDLKSHFKLDILIILVIATFILAGGYVGYQYSQDPSNFEAHNITYDATVYTIDSSMSNISSLNKITTTTTN